MEDQDYLTYRRSDLESFSRSLPTWITADLLDEWEAKERARVPTRDSYIRVIDQIRRLYIRVHGEPRRHDKVGKLTEEIKEKERAYWSRYRRTHGESGSEESDSS